MGMFNAPEIINMGIEKEIKRRDFYGKVSEVFTDKEMKKLFGQLRDWEETHIEIFKKLKEQAIESQTTEKYPGEESAYINAMLDDTLYKNVSPKEFGKNIKSPLDAVQYGIGFEKDAILFFKEFLNYSAPHYKETIQTLINEEKQHIVYLAQLKKKINTGKSDNVKGTCPTCLRSTGKSGHMCMPLTQKDKRCDWCKALIPDERHLCNEKIKEITYICNSCGRTAVKAEYLCDPKSVK
jgi:rubrerythrin